MKEDMHFARLALFICGLVFAGVSTASAGPLGLDPDGMPGFTGTVSFNASDELVADLDYAVFALGDYPDDGATGNDPSDGSEFVYAYQVFNVSPSRSLTTVSVGLVEDSGAHNAVWDLLHVMLDGVEPYSTQVYPGSTSVITRFFNPPVPSVDGYSAVFLFTSPNPPTYISTSVQSGGFVDTQMAPSPTPEPGGLVLLGLGCLIALGRRHV